MARHIKVGAVITLRSISLTISVNSKKQSREYSFSRSIDLTCEAGRLARAHIDDESGYHAMMQPPVTSSVTSGSLSNTRRNSLVN